MSFFAVRDAWIPDFKSNPTFQRIEFTNLDFSEGFNQPTAGSCPHVNHNTAWNLTDCCKNCCLIVLIWLKSFEITYWQEWMILILNNSDSKWIIIFVIKVISEFLSKSASFLNFRLGLKTSPGSHNVLWGSEKVERKDRQSLLTIN